MSDLPNELRRLAKLDHSNVLGDEMRKAAAEIERMRGENEIMRGIPCWSGPDGEPGPPDLGAYADAVRERDDLAMMCRRLVRQCSGNPIASQATDLLQRMGLAGSPLRSAKAWRCEG